MKASTSQKGLITRLLKTLELDTRTISLMHKNVLSNARLWSPSLNGKDMDTWLGGLNGFQAGLLISQLNLEVANG